MSSWPPPERPRLQISQLPYLRGLDGMRALAVVAVMVYHANHHWLSGGFLGVEVFFVISGYLITLLLIGEHEREGRVALGQFWMRRARRLLPALFVVLTALVLYMALFKPRPQGRTRGDVVAGLLYGSNWYQIAVGQGYTATEAFAPLRHLWSLAVEEQFYLLWPLVMVLILRRGRDHLPKVALWLVGTSVAIAVATGLLFVGGDIPVECATGTPHGYARVLGRCISINETLYLGTFSRASGLLLGAAFAMLFRPVAVMRGPMRRKGHLLDLVALVGLAVLVLQMTRLSLAESGVSLGQRFDPWLFRGGFFVTALATLAVIAAVVHRGAFMGRILGNPLFNWVGTRSYGLYLFHWPIYQIIRDSAGVDLSWLQFVVAMIITVPITEASYRFVEMPVRQGRLRQWMRSDRRVSRAVTYRNRRRLVLVLAAASSLVGFAGVSIAVADNVCVGDVECSLEVGDVVVAAPVNTGATLPPPSDSTTTTTTTIASDDPDAMGSKPPVGGGTPTATTVAETTTTTAAPPPQLPPAAFGESVMLGAVANLQQGGFNVDAAKSRQGADMVATIAYWRTQGWIGDTVVLQIGTNGGISDDTFAQIMAQLPADTTPHVIVLTVQAPKGWIDGNNAIIRNLPNVYPNVSILDWQYAAGFIRLCSDQVHIACGGGAAQYYADKIFLAIGRPDLVQNPVSTAPPPTDPPATQPPVTEPPATPAPTAAPAETTSPP